MATALAFNSLLVPVDFSEPSQEVLQRAVQLVDGDEPTVLLVHVIDDELVTLMVSSGFGDRDDIVGRLRKQAEDKLASCALAIPNGVQSTHVVCVGVPFIEIIRKATDFAVDAIVMGRAGAGRQVGHLLFGSTAEHVLRGSTRPVIVLPNAPSPSS